jgi:hypothetical protein
VPEQATGMQVGVDKIMERVYDSKDESEVIFWCRVGGIIVASSIPAAGRTRQARSTHGFAPVHPFEREEPRVPPGSGPFGEVAEGAARGMEVVEVRVEVTSAPGVVAVLAVEMAAEEVVAHPSSRRDRA